MAPADDPNSLGRLLRDRDMITDSQLYDALKFAKAMSPSKERPMKLGEALVKMDVLTQQQIDVVLSRQGFNKTDEPHHKHEAVAEALQAAAKAVTAHSIAEEQRADAARKITLNDDLHED